MACPTLTSPRNGRLFGGKRRVFGDEAYYVCNNGYKLIGEETRVCEKNTSWSGSMPHCQGISDFIFKLENDC